MVEPSHPWGVDVTVCLRDEDASQQCEVLGTDAFGIVVGTDLFHRNPKVKLLSLQRSYGLHRNFGSGLYSVSPGLTGRKDSGLCYVNGPYRTEK